LENFVFLHPKGILPNRDWEGAMYFEQFYLGCLAHASYLLGSEGVGVVVDPQRDVDLYLAAARKQGLTIAHIFETHLHADFVSGHRELAERTGARIYIGTQAEASFPHVPLTDGFELFFGRCRIQTLHTPGHTPESICLKIYDAERQPAPWAVLTGDTLFIGDVGRPDLSPTHTPQQLAALLYDSLHGKLLTLPDDTLVFPAHGAGSLCGRNMRAERHSTIGTERRTNYALQIHPREAFVNALTAHLPVRPAYFAEDVAINRQGADTLTDLPEPSALTPRQVRDLRRGEVFVLDTRPAGDYALAHVPGSVCIGLQGEFASWAGSVIGLHQPVVLVAESPERMREARMRLARVGVERVIGWLADGITGWRSSGFSTAHLPQITVAELHELLTRGTATVLDVRRERERQAGYIAGARWHALDAFPAQLPFFKSHALTAVHCQSGYRSVIAAGLLLRAGYKQVANVHGGFSAWVAAGLPVARPGAIAA
jgi:hydroxyacylglutathione hydrolase